MNILMISSSPRKGGNSDLLCDQFGKGAFESGHQVKKIQLAGKAIGFCTACYDCKKNGKCVQNDDVAEILDAMMEADLIVLATPVYFYGMSAQLKALIDRTFAIYPNMKNKRFFFLITLGDKKSEESLAGTVEGLRGFLACYEGSKDLGMVVSGNTYEKGAVKQNPAWEEAYLAGRKLK